MKWRQKYDRSDERGSQKYIQEFVNYRSDYLNKLIRSNSTSLTNYSNEKNANLYRESWCKDAV